MNNYINPLILIGALFPSFSQVTSGVGAPTIGNSIFIGSPALILTSLQGPKRSLSNFGFSE
jgi:hypothetical protein